MANISISVTGLDQVQAALAEFPKQVGGYMRAAGQEVGTEVVQTVGVGKYPPAGPGNAPPTPYYVRGVGRQYASYNDNRSERLGTQFTVDASPDGFGVVIGNRASYAPYDVGDDQARAMAAIGWVKVYDAAVSTLDKITAIFQAWIDKLIKDLNLT
jgi:hypothetical protein